MLVASQLLATCHSRLTLHHIHHESGERLREEVGRLVGHAFACRRDGLHLADLCRVEQQGSGSHSLRYPIQGFMVVLRLEDGFLFLLFRTERRDDKLLEQRYIELGAGRGLRRWTMGWFHAQCDVAVVILQRQPKHREGSASRPHRLAQSWTSHSSSNWSSLNSARRHRNKKRFSIPKTIMKRWIGWHAELERGPCSSTPPRSAKCKPSRRQANACPTNRRTSSRSR